MANGVRARVERGEPLIDRGADRGMEDRLEVPPLVDVGEHQGGQRPAIQIAVGGQDAAAEPRHDGVESRRAVRDHVARERVGVDGRHAQGVEDGPHMALAGAHAAGQGDALHLRVLGCQAGSVGPGSTAAGRAGVSRSSTNVFHSWHCGHCHSSSVLR